MSMKSFMRLLLILLVLGALLPLFIRGPDGRPIMSFADWVPNWGASTPSATLSSDADAPARLSSDSGKMYKWQDAQGRWHFSEEKPLDQSTAAVESLPDVQNVMDAPVAGRSNSSTIALPEGLSEAASELMQAMQRDGKE